MTALLYVEGGGNGKALRVECRKGFAQFLAKAGLKGRMPRIRASGSRQDASPRARSLVDTLMADALG